MKQDLDGFDFDFRVEDKMGLLKERDQTIVTLETEISEVFYPDLIFVIFSPHRKFLDKFFSTQKCVNYDKTDFATKFVFDKTDFFSRK